MRHEQGPRDPRRCRRMDVEAAQRQQRPAEDKHKRREQRGHPALAPPAGQPVGSGCCQAKMHDVVHRVGEVDGEQNEEQRVGIEEKEVGVGQHRLTIVQVRTPVRQVSVPADFMDEARVRVAVIENVAIKKHGGREDNPPEDDQQRSNQRCDCRRVRSNEPARDAPEGRFRALGMRPTVIGLEPGRLHRQTAFGHCRKAQGTKGQRTTDAFV